MTLQQAAQQAIDCQDACNLSGVLNTLNEVVRDVIRPEAERLGKGTDWVNEHPIVAMFLDKLVDLNRYGRTDNVWTGENRAYDQVRAIAYPSLEHDPAKAGEMDCYVCGYKIGDAEYQVNAENMPRHHICPLS